MLTEPKLQAGFELIRDGRIDEALVAHLLELNDLPCNMIGAPYMLFQDRPRWNGETVRRLVVLWPFTAEYAATGAGDFLMFARYLVEARKRCEHLTVHAPPSMHAIARRCVGVDVVCAPGMLREALLAADAYTVLWMPIAVAVSQGYGEPLPLTPLPGLAPSLAPGVRHVGLCWAASQEFGTLRTIRPPSQFDALASLPGVQFHCLQAWPFHHEARPWMVKHKLASWDHTAALVAQLDAVVTVDTGVAHIAGSLGVPTHLVLTDYEDWRWGPGERTGWYPSMRLHRGDPVANFCAAAIALAQGIEPTPRARVDLPSVDVGTLWPETIRKTGPYMSSTDLRALLGLVKGARRVLEIGVQEGDTAAFLLANFPEIETYQGVDVLPGYRFERTHQAGEVPRTPGARAASDRRFRLVLRARGAFDLSAADLEPCDAVFIDGDHGRNAIRHDTALARSVLRPGGVIIWHDYGNSTTPDVREVLNAFRAEGRDVHRVAGSWVAFERVY